MQTIETYIVPCTNFKPTRIVARQSGGPARIIRSKSEIENSFSAHCAINDDMIHRKMAELFMQKMNWDNPIVGGHTKRGMVWVLLDEHSR